MADYKVDEKVMASSHHIDNREPSIADDEKLQAEKVAAQNAEHLDKFGAWAKSNPAEIALVRKLDIYMMVSFSSPD